MKIQNHIYKQRYSCVTSTEEHNSQK